MGKRQVELIYKNINKQINSFNKSQNNCCEIGCSHCCYQLIEILNIEKSTITKRLKKDLKTETKIILKKNLNEWLDFFDRNTSNNINEFEIFTKLKEIISRERIKCPMLINNKCSIYSFRPLTCRLHSVEHSPELCETDPYRDPSENVLSERRKIVSGLKQRMEVSVEPFAYTVAKILLPSRKLKPIDTLVLK